MIDDIVAEITARVERNITARMDELKAFLKELVGNCATKQCVEDKFQAVDKVLSGIEKRLEALEKKVEAISSGVFGMNVQADGLVRNVDTLQHMRDLTVMRGSLTKNLKSFHGALCQCPQGMDGQGECDNHLRQHH